MEKRTKNFLITTESHEITIVRRHGSDRIREMCPECGVEATFVDFDHARRLSGLNGQALAREIGSGLVHSIEIGGGYLAICEMSLEAREGNENTEIQY